MEEHIEAMQEGEVSNKYLPKMADYLPRIQVYNHHNKNKSGIFLEEYIAVVHRSLSCRSHSL